MARSPLFVRKQPGGVYHVDNTFLTVGNIWYVDSGSSGKGTSSSYGYSPDSPLSTVAAAWDRTAPTLAAGDIILVAAGHTESIAAAAGWDCDTAGVRLKGMGVGRNRPTITFDTATTADADIDAANIAFENLYFVCTGIDAVAAAIDVNSANFELLQCELLLATASAQCTVAVLADGSGDRMRVEGCYFHGTTDTGTDTPISTGAGDDTLIRNNILCGAYAAANGAIYNSAAAINFNIIGNFIMNLTADGNNKAIVAHASTTGLIADNRIAIIDSTGPAPITAAAMYVSSNYTTGAAGVGAASVLL